MKSNAIIRIVIWSIVIVVLLVLMVSILGSSRLIRDVPTSNTYEESIELIPGSTQHFSAEQVTDLNIEWAAGSITIQPGDVDEITVSESEVTDKDYVMVCKQKGSTLTIAFCKESTINFNFGITVNNLMDKDLHITVPRDWICDSLDIDAASATLDVYDLKIREVEFDGASGTCEFTRCTVDKLDLDTASGDVRFVGSLDILDCDAASASVYAELDNIPSRMDMDSMSGDLDITLPESAGFTVTMDGMSSDFTSDFETTISNGSYICGDGSCRINVDAMSGDVNIRKGQ